MSKVNSVSVFTLELMKLSLRQVQNKNNWIFNTIGFTLRLTVTKYF